MIYRRVPSVLRFMPESLQRFVLHFEASIEDAVRGFAGSLHPAARILDAGAGECQYAPLLKEQRYTAVDLGVGDNSWSYRQLDAISDLQDLPFRENTFDGCLNIVTLEHVRQPGRVLCEIGRVLKRGGRLLLVTPLEWEEHQTPHDYFRFTRYGVTLLLESAGFHVERIQPVGGFFRLLARRVLVAPQFFRAPLGPILLLLVAPFGLIISVLDRFDRERAFTLGHICIARKL